MALITITNISDEIVDLPDAYINLRPGETASIFRYLPELEKEPLIFALRNNNRVSWTISIDPWELEYRGYAGKGIDFQRIWTFQTAAAVQYIGGFYDFSGTDNDFSPSITLGDVDYGKAAHVLFVLGAVTVDELTIVVTGDSITDTGVQFEGDAEGIIIPAGTPADSYFETHKKFNGQVTIEAVGGTPVTANYGWAKYHDFANQDFIVKALECLWESDSTDSASDIQLIHHRATGWTFNSGAVPTPPPPIAARSIDHAGNDTHAVGSGSWKRTNLAVAVAGSASEGIMFCVHSGTTGLGTLSFRLMTCEATLELVNNGVGQG